MSQQTSIEWTDYSSNPLKYRDAAGKIVWACAKVSAGCKNCYAETIAHRWKRGGPFSLQQIQKVTPLVDDKECRFLLRSKKLVGKRVFIGDMTDLFGDWVPFDLLDRLFAVFALRPDVTFQVLTKRPERMAEYLAAARSTDNLEEEIARLKLHLTGDYEPWFFDNRPDRWPMPNVWLGASCEDQEQLNKRMPPLLECPAAVRFISAEPLLGPVDLLRVDAEGFGGPSGHKIDCIRKGYWSGGPLGFVNHSDMHDRFGPLHWVIIGCESNGRMAGRFADGYEAAAQSIIDQCAAPGVPCFHKQMPINGRVSHDPSEWKPSLRVREFPHGAMVA